MPPPAQVRPTWLWVRRVVFLLSLVIAITYPVLYLYLARHGEDRPDLLFDAALGLLAAWFLWHVARAPMRQAHACPSCAGALRRTRNTTGARFWTCSACGYERPRLRPRPERGPEAPRNRAVN